MKRIFCIIALSLMLVTAASAAAPSAIPEVAVALSQTSFSAPGPVGVTITVTATQDMPGPCTLYDPNGVRIAEFGTPTLSAGESAVWTGAWQVTQAQLDAGELVFAVVWFEPDGNGASVMKQQAYRAPLPRFDTDSFFRQRAADPQARTMQLLTAVTRLHMTQAQAPAVN